MTVTVEIRDDPDRPGGGHALLLFRGAADPGTSVSLSLEPLTEGFDYRGPRRLNAPSKPVPEGFEVAIGPDVVTALPPGVAMELGVAGSGIAVEVRWPTLAQKAAQPRRQVVKPQIRRVVAGPEASPQAPPPSPRPPQAAPADVRPPQAPPAEPRPPQVPPAEPRAPQVAGTESRPGAEAAPPPPPPRAPDDVAAGVAAGADRSPEAARPTDLGETATSTGATPGGGAVVPTADPLKSERTPEQAGPGSRTAATADRGWRTSRVAAAACVAFLAGAAAAGGLLLSRPAPTTPATAPAAGTAALPSPYTILNALTDRSPKGLHVDPREAKVFRERGDAATSPDEADFWHGWAMRSLLTGRTNDTAATLSDFATDLARTKGSGDDPGALSAARFLWEMAALARDCSAMENIATALARGGPGSKDKEAAVWRDRALKCRIGNGVPQ